MPELPEVETIVRELHEVVVGKTVVRFSVFDVQRIVRPCLSLPQKITAVRRHGKYIVCDLSGGARCVVHLRMTGELLFAPVVPAKAGTRNPKLPLNQKHERAAFHFSDGSCLRFVDVRRFGTVEWRKSGDPLPMLGIDPLSQSFSSKAFLHLSQKSIRPIKSFLLDQQKIAGIGNIYADEALWHAKIRPSRKTGSLKAPEIKALVSAIRRVLREGIKKGGFTLRDYRRIDGSFGYYQKSRKVYNREGEKCKRCHATIRRIKVGGRSSYYCLQCQL
ncbi:MAG TPA: bifunctional DNA-formamidopyrimidine glycosylase/DNA-(apurinic or apyrimidinic site) lyase [Candidatus Paceibacterota bacterium]|nr:bifunctional DNA-formamidopyrimidine glycosylase/DNA-(apurinic or apyrimidinic site) lyase [Candidatus Paceibacterota bacterium]